MQSLRQDRMVAEEVCRMEKEPYPGERQEVGVRAQESLPPSAE
jgi:hypothetical protein